MAWWLWYVAGICSGFWLGITTLSLLIISKTQFPRKRSVAVLSESIQPPRASYLNHE